MKAKKVIALVMCAAMVAGMSASSVMAADMPEDSGHSDGLSADVPHPSPAVDRGGVHRVCPRNAADGAAHVYFLRTSHGRLHAAGHFVDPELFAFFRRHYRHEHQQLRLRR